MLVIHFHSGHLFLIKKLANMVFPLSMNVRFSDILTHLKASSDVDEQL